MQRCSSPFPDPALTRCARRWAATASACSFAEMEQLGRNPGRIVGAWRDFVRHHAGGDTTPLGIGSRSGPSGPRPSSSSASARDAAEPRLAPGRRRGRCCAPTTLRALARRSSRGRAATTRTSSNAARRTAATGAPARSPARSRCPPPPTRSPSCASGTATWSTCASSSASAPPRPASRAGDATTSCSPSTSSATNSLRYARGERTLRTWRDDGSLIVEVVDDSHIADPLAAATSPAPMRSAAAACTWSTSSATSCGCARRPTAASCASTCIWTDPRRAPTDRLSGRTG